MRLFPISVVLLLAWGALAMGGDPSWAGAPVAVFAIATAVLGFLERRGNGSTVRASAALPHRSVILAVGLFLTATGMQLVPLPAAIVAKLSPARDTVEFERLLATADRRDPDLVQATVAGAARPLSIAPVRTWWGLGFAAAFGLYVIGVSYGLSATSVSSIARALAVVGVAVAFLGIYQRSTGSSIVYGLYVPIEYRPQSAPFINRNHQAGWLVMVLSLTIGLFAGDVARGMRNVSPRWRARAIWFSSKEASIAMMLLFAVAILAIGILITQSRSGALALALAVSVLAVFSGRRQSSATRRRVTSVGLFAAALLAFFTNGSGVMSRFAAASWVTGEGRLTAWQDSLLIIRDFWLTGTGFNTYGVSMLHYQSGEATGRFIEAHNEYLQLAAEGGWMLGGPVFLLIASLVVEIRRRFREDADDTRTYWLRVGAVTGLLAIALQSLVEFTLQMPGAAVAFATLLAIAIHHPRPRTTEHERHAE